MEQTSRALWPAGESSRVVATVEGRMNKVSPENDTFRAFLPR